MHTVKDASVASELHTEGVHGSDTGVGSQALQGAQGVAGQQKQQAGHTVLGGGEITPSTASGQGPSATEQTGAAQGGAVPQGAPSFSVKFPDDVPVSQELLENYQAFCADCGLSNEQAQQAVDFYLKEQTRQMDAERELSMHILENGAWKGQFEERLSVANNAVRALDAQLGGRLQPMLEAGLGNNHVFAEMMACVGDLLQEENFIPHAGGAASNRSMSTEDFLRNEVFKTR